MKVTPAPLEGILLVDPDVHGDERGFFTESYQTDRYHQAGIAASFIQDNHSKSCQHTLRGLHAQLSHPQSKLVRVVQGAVLDVVVDLRPNSPSFGQWFSIELSARNFRQIFVPIGFAHGFCVLSPTAEVEYKCSDIYDPSQEICLRWDDPEVGIEWPTASPLLSEKDTQGKLLRELHGDLSCFEKAVG